MAPISIKAFQNTLRVAATQHRHNYTNIHSMTYFQNLLKTLNIPPAIEHIIRHSSPNPDIPFQQAFHDILDESQPKTKSDHNLLIFHYAGHGFIKNGQLTFAETATAEKTLNAGISTRAPIISNRVVEILAATSTQIPRNRILPENTFTAKLAEEIACRKRSGHKYVEIADVFQTLRSRGERDRLRPTHALLVGVESVVLPLDGSCAVDPVTVAPMCTALFSVSVAKEMTAEELRQLSSWMKNLPCFAGLEVDKGYSLIAEDVRAPIDLDNLSTGYEKYHNE
ncbi:hypothetical protein M752DRAFT_262021 [Aspergillus phoenicis ATCC 13157]|uniref:Uncharacterized protein n=1 Tax=Aspergillus phoenicis ATCC 13157 TaxID=1353007 RepID=A0A370PY18_ASPPH|nr:hypothetical protein M752DRAFT_262021 [Aspergillus phoenicis ATCC 13157]